MSYEGYLQLLCSSGHYSEVSDAKWHHSVGELKCSCGEEFVWAHPVDRTNGCIHDPSKHVDRCCGIPMSEFSIRSRVEYPTCPTCQHTKDPEVTYFPPPKKGVVFSSRSWRP